MLPLTIKDFFVPHPAHDSLSFALKNVTFIFNTQSSHGNEDQKINLHHVSGKISQECTHICLNSWCYLTPD